MSRSLLLATLFLAGSTPALAQGAPVTFGLRTTVQTPSLGTGLLALSPDGQAVAVLRPDGRQREGAALVLSEARTGRERWRSAMPNTFAGAVVFSPDGRTLVSVGAEVRAHDVTTGRERWSSALPSSLAAAFSPDGERVYLASPGGTLHLLDAQTGKVVWGEPDSVNPGSAAYYRSGAFYNRPQTLAVHPAGQRVVSGSFGGGIVLWDALTGERTGTLTDRPSSRRPTQAALTGKTAHGGRVTALTFAPDGTLISGANDGTVKRWNLETGQKLTEASLPDGVQGSALLPGGRGVLVTSGTNVVQLSLPDLRRERVLVGHAEKVWSLALSGNALWTSSADGTVKRWNLKTGLDEATYGTVKTAAVSPDGQTFALNLGDTTVRLTDARGHTLRTLRGFLPPRTRFDSIGSRSLAFSPGGKTLAGGITTLFHMTMERYPAGSTVYLWDVLGSKGPRTLSGMPGDALTFSPNGQQVLGVNQRQGQVPAYGVRRVADGTVVAAPCQPYRPDGQPTGAKCPLEEVRGVSWVGSRVYTLSLKQDGGQRPAALVRDGVTGGVRVTLGMVWNNGPSMGLSPDGKRVVSLAGNGLQVWDGRTGRSLRVWPEFINPAPYRGDPILFSPDGQSFTFPGPDLRLHATATGQLLGEQKGAGEVVGFVQGGRSLVTRSDRGVQVWQIRKGGIPVP